MLKVFFGQPVVLVPVSLTATGSQLALTGGSATLSATANVWLTATGSALALSGGAATFGLSFPAVGSQLALTGGTASMAATGNAWLTATGAAVALTGGTASFTWTQHYWLDGTGSEITLAGGNASLEAQVNLVLDGTGCALTLTGGDAAFSLTEIAQASAQPAGGWAAFNEADARRQRKRRQDSEDEAERQRLELAERLEQQLLAEGVINDAQAELLRLRGLAAQYVGADLPNRTKRALAYAERAQTVVSAQLALRELQRVAEDEEMTLLLILAAA